MKKLEYKVSIFICCAQYPLISKYKEGETK